MMNTQEQVNKAIDVTSKILDAAHQTTVANMKAKSLKTAISSYNREIAIQMIHEYVEKYKIIINATYPLTGRFVTYAENFYSDKDNDYIKTDLSFLVLMVYLQEAAKFGLNITADKAIKKIFGETEAATNA